MYNFLFFSLFLCTERTKQLLDWLKFIQWRRKSHTTTMFHAENVTRFSFLCHIQVSMWTTTNDETKAEKMNMGMAFTLFCVSLSCVLTNPRQTLDPRFFSINLTCTKLKDQFHLKQLKCSVYSMKLMSSRRTTLFRSMGLSERYLLMEMVNQNWIRGSKCTWNF